MVQNQPEQIVHETLAQGEGEGPEFKPQYCKKKAPRRLNSKSTQGSVVSSASFWLL
jgi:hypothetical protein